MLVRTKLSLLFFPVPSSGLPALSSENALSRARSYSHGTSGSSGSQQNSPQIKAAPSFTFSCNRAGGPAGGSQSPQKGSPRVLAPVRGKLGGEPLLAFIQYLWSCCVRRRP